MMNQIYCPACVSVGFVAALQYVEHVGCESDVYCVTQGLLFFWPDHMLTVPLRSSWDIARGPKSNIMFVCFPLHALHFFPRTDSPAKPQLTPKSNA